MVGTSSGRTYSIKEVAALVGLPASTLRYYEDVNVILRVVIEFIGKMTSSC